MNMKFLYPNGKNKALTISYDDGVTFDERLIEILNSYNLKATFNLNSGTKPGLIFNKNGVDIIALDLEKNKDIYKNHEVSIHTLTHPHLDQLGDDEVVKEVLEDKINLEKTFGGIIRGMAYPFGGYNSKVKDIIKSCGVDYSRTVVQTEDFTLPADFLEWHSTCRHANPQLMDLADSFLVKEDGELDLFYLWGHSFEFEIHNNWEIIEEFAAKISNNHDIWYATNIEIFDYITAVRSLKFSGDKSRVYNPTALDIYLGVNGTVVKLSPNTTLELL